MSKLLDVMQSSDLSGLQQTRAGETRLGQQLQFVNPLLPIADALLTAREHGCRFALLGIPEDIGPRANLGNGGADLGFQAFLSRFINLQSNDAIPACEILLLGTVHCVDLQAQSASLDASKDADLAVLRQLCAELDERVFGVAQLILQAGMYPIVIGGGHNNAYPLLRALSAQHDQAVQAINLDPHCDFRLIEGRHSGNGFSYAKQAGWLQRYFVLGLHELKNSSAALQQLKNANGSYLSYQQIWQRREVSFPRAVEQALQYVDATKPIPFAIELDTDSISGMPVSAYTNCGISVADAEYYVWRLAREPQSAYLHLAEAAPSQHPAGLKAGMNEAGQILSALVVAFLQAKQA